MTQVGRRRISPRASWVEPRHRRTLTLAQRWPPAVSASVTDKLSVAQLEQSLWSAADILRGSIDSSDYKTYIFGLLFLKRLSDRFEEEAEKLVADGMSKEVAWNDPDEHQFYVPDRAPVGRHPNDGHEHRRGAEQGVRGA